MSKSENIQEQILKRLFVSDEFFHKTFHFLREEYLNSKDFFSHTNEQVFKLLINCNEKFNVRPTFKMVANEIVSDVNLSKNELGQEIKEKLKEINQTKTLNNDNYYFQMAEKHKINTNLRNAIYSALSLYEKSNENLENVNVNQIETQVLSEIQKSLTGFTQKFAKFSNFKNRNYGEVTLYKTGFPVVDFKIGGVKKKTFNLILAPSDGGKTAALIEMAYECWNQGEKVLYLSFEQPEKEILQRFDSKLLDEKINNFDNINQDEFEKRVENIDIKDKGEIIVIDFPSGTCSANQVKKILYSLKYTENFVPDKIFIDYLGLAAPNHFNRNYTSFQMFKTISEELRAVAQEMDTIIFTAQQIKRGTGWGSITFEDISESIGPIFTSFLVLGIYYNSKEAKEKGAMKMEIMKSKRGFVGTTFYNYFDYSKGIIKSLTLGEYCELDPSEEANEQQENCISKIMEDSININNNDESNEMLIDSIKNNLDL